MYKSIFMVLMILQNCGASNTEDRSKLVIDISKDCEQNYFTSIRLPFGSGSSDARIILLRSIDSSLRNCSILIIGPNAHSSCGDKCMTLITVEMFNYKLPRTACASIVGEIRLLFDNNQTTTICKDLQRKYKKRNVKHQIQSYLMRERKFGIEMDFRNVSATIKITLTSAKYLGIYTNCTSKELNCVFEGQVFCIDKLLECDGNINCGTPDLYDEYCTNLRFDENILPMILYTICLTAVIMFFFVQILHICVPTVSDNFFVFKEGEENKFVLTSQSLPPLKLIRTIDYESEQETQRSSKSTSTEIY